MLQDQTINALTPLFGDRFSRHPAHRATHAHGEANPTAHEPDAVVFAHSTEEVAALLKHCHAHHIPVTAFGAGTSLEGHVTPVQGGISLDLSQMNQILAVHDADLDVRVQAGVTRRQLNGELRDRGLFFPVDPGADCTIGGMCATRASGTNAVRYGTMRENVLGLRAVLADGTIVDTGGRVRKSSTGYDLTRLLIGSEGTLGIITEIQLRLFGVPEATGAAICQFTSVAGAVSSVIEIIQSGIPVARIEFVDAAQMAASIAYSKLTAMQALPTLLFEFHGSEASVAEQAQQAEAITTGYGGAAFAFATAAEDRNRLWQARHDAFWAARASRPGYAVFTTDTIVPISRLAEAIAQADAAVTRSGLDACVVGHVGDGNFHVMILFPDTPEAAARAWALDREIVAQALDLGGAASGEHGVGLGKREFLRREHGAPALAMMRAIKTALDPRGILNPGKILLDAPTSDG
ncbi:MAG TPA: FAD-linked oxidase C-terminal domain-containing protein [Acidiphilium sp.]|nr:MAG: 2-hydroxy-acid oxidase [Acidiphilium sp. 21-60-14]OYV92242.1 MAG: 2-hydroxy-acid oxidase [Acidiphilium sp. 37-60-79]HQT87389.1 FAD-linked oxidase C-terminal domain-containing protein [Acidiphilium sp.]HQU23095.1 FAD-linked oxidase C-terminal domain-containing protein [Acidiphilium sp.]